MSRFNVLLGVTGSIACYKSLLVARLLHKSNIHVKIVLTPSVEQFVSPLTFSTLINEKVFVNFSENGIWNNHVDLACWANVFVIAPLTCNTLAKMASGICDNLLMATYFSCTAPKIVAPAMDLDMWVHEVTKRNIETIKKSGCSVIDVGHGELASGLVGSGRMAEPEAIVDIIMKSLNYNNN